MSQEPDDLDLAARELCPDDACIGVLGADGICPECGRTRDGQQVVSRAGVELAANGADAADGAGAADSAAPAFDDDRELCPDDACIGLLGEDGRCRECGRSRQS